MNDRVGWSFLSEPANGLQHSFQHLQQRAWHDKDNGLMAKRRWVPSKVTKYLQQVVAFQPLLLLCIHFTGGMPGRGTEIGTIRWCNTRTAMRSVFVQHAMLLIIIEYQKAQRTTNKAFYVVRALPPVVSQLLFRYLAFVRPFAEALSHQATQLQSKQSESVPYIFSTSSGAPFQASQITAALKKHSERTCSAILTVALYRQTVLAIAKQHIATIALPFNAQRPEHINKIWRDIAMQAAHNVRTLTNNYALDKSCPARLQPELIGRYLAISEFWHRWLQLEQLEEKQKQTQTQQRQAQPKPVLGLTSAPNSGPVTASISGAERCSSPEVMPERGSSPEVIPQRSSSLGVVLQRSSSPELIPERGSSPEVMPERGSSPEVMPERGSSPEVIPQRSSSLGVVLQRGSSPELIPERGSSPEVILERSSSPEVILERCSPWEVLQECYNLPEVIRSQCNTPEPTPYVLPLFRRKSGSRKKARCPDWVLCPPAQRLPVKKFR